MAWDYIQQKIAEMSSSMMAAGELRERVANGLIPLLALQDRDFVGASEDIREKWAALRSAMMEPIAGKSDQIDQRLSSMSSDEVEGVGRILNDLVWAAIYQAGDEGE